VNQLENMADLLRGRRIVVLSGAGISTESGIPDYRGPSSRARAARPMTYREFTVSAEKRARYWARSALGWTRVAGAAPNAGHAALARMERAGVVTGIITQNVDGLHQAAGSARVLELHGSLSAVVCLGCGHRLPRTDMQDRILGLNPGWDAAAVEIAPDGDAEADPASGSFAVPPCPECGGILKPDVVFFGETVPKDRVERAFRMADDGEVLLVTGSSLTVYSGYRFVEHAAKQGRPIGIMNMGPTRGDRLGTARVEAPLGDSLTMLCEMLQGEDRWK
jgi:NAD-dependent deacetylase sirtuin 4